MQRRIMEPKITPFFLKSPKSKVLFEPSLPSAKESREKQLPIDWIQTHSDEKLTQEDFQLPKCRHNDGLPALRCWPSVRRCSVESRSNVWPYYKSFQHDCDASDSAAVRLSQKWAIFVRRAIARDQYKSVEYVAVAKKLMRHILHTSSAAHRLGEFHRKQKCAYNR